MTNPVRQENLRKRLAKMKEAQAARKMVSRKTALGQPKKVYSYPEIRRARPRPGPKTAPTLSVQSVPPNPNAKSITVDAVQGLGDIYWIYQKLAPLYDEINLNICVLGLDKIQERSREWIPLFPKIRDCKFRIVKEAEYQIMAATKFKLDETIKQWERGVDSVKYNCNRWLEEGTRIDEIDSHPVQETVDLKLEEFPLPFKDYITLYVSGSTRHHGKTVWSLEEWISFVKLIYAKYQVKYPVMIPGAGYDNTVANELASALTNNGIENQVFVGHTPGKVCHLLKNTKLLVGYQSGLNVIADNYDTPQVMMYFNHLVDMRYTWCKRKNMLSRFNAAIFSDKPKAVNYRVNLEPFLK